MSSDPFLECAMTIGRRIAVEAIWHDGCCSWVGAVAEPADRSRPEYRPVGPLVYDGTAGIALFLAELAMVTGEESLRRTATGALRHAISRAGRRDGFHAGTLGVAWAAARAGDRLGAEEPAAGARSLIDAPVAGLRPDLVQGRAGAIVALLGLREIGAAAQAGEALLAGATVTRRGWSWADPAKRTPRHLCGVAHGAAGIGWALLELWAATGDTRFEAAARGAFAYERSWLDRASGIWPDLRTPAAPESMVATWCYGEAGIALSRLCAHAILGDGPHCPDADIALNTARAHLTAALPYAIDDLSLCHGLGGAALALLAAGDRESAVALGHVALDRYGESGDWPCGVYGTTPGLMRGLSGIGWLFLCLHDPGIASPLSLG
jgi:class II lanthipeptide synthase